MGLSLAKTSPHLARVNLSLGCQPLVGYEEDHPTGPFEGRPLQVDSFLSNTLPRGICGNVKGNSIRPISLLSGGIGEIE